RVQVDGLVPLATAGRNDRERSVQRKPRCKPVFQDFEAEPMRAVKWHDSFSRRSWPAIRFGDIAPARRPSAGAEPGRRGACLAVRPPPAAFVRSVPNHTPVPALLLFRRSELVQA